MNGATLLVLLAILALIALAVRSIRKSKLLGRCGGDCARCQMRCQNTKDER